MYLNKFSVRVVGGVEKSSGYVELDHGQVYKLCLRNARNVQCDAKVEIDGKDMGTWRIYAGSSITLERPSHDDGEFTFYQVGTKEAQKAQLEVYSPNLGLVKVTFTPEIKRIRAVSRLGSIDEVHIYNTSWSPMVFGAVMPDTQLSCRGSSAGASKSLAGGTGLSGQSQQRFGTASTIEYDYAQGTTINLRLVAKKANGPRPLTARSNPVPPRFY